MPSPDDAARDGRAPAAAPTPVPGTAADAASVHRPEAPAPVLVLGDGTAARQHAAEVARADLVLGARRHLDAMSVPEPHRLVLGPLAPALDALAAARAAGRRAVVLASGDPGFFGIVRVLAERLGPEALDVRPGVSSVARAFARLGLPWDDAVVVSAHGRDPRTAVNLCRARRKVAVLTAPGAGPAEFGAALAATPGLRRRLLVCSALGTDRERITETTPEQAAARSWPDVNLLVCLAGSAADPTAHPTADPTADPTAAPAAGTGPVGPMGTVAGWSGPPPGGWALDESAFAHRDAMVTKAEIRALALARLGPRPGELVWDVGAGSGSVAVECARLGAAVIAVERAADGADRVRANAAAHGVEVSVVHGAAPEALAGLPEPDAVFVGGGGADLDAIVRACADRARRTVVVAVAALDRVPVARTALREGGFTVEGAQLQVSRLAPLPGDVSRLSAANPVFVLWGSRTPAGEVRAGRQPRTHEAPTPTPTSAPTSGVPE